MGQTELSYAGLTQVLFSVTQSEADFQREMLMPQRIHTELVVSLWACTPLFAPNIVIPSRGTQASKQPSVLPVR